MNAAHEVLVLHGRARAYGLSARLLLRGVDDVAWARLGETPGLLDSLDHATDRDELAAEHHTAFHLGVFPYAGAFLSVEAQAGASSDRVRSLFAQAGFEPQLDEVAADHLGVLFAFLSFASGAQAEAVEDGQHTLARRLGAIICEVQDTCVLSWMPSFAVAMDDGSAFWREVVGVALGMTAAHRHQVDQAPYPVALPTLVSPLADERNGLREIAEFLLTPARSGAFLSRNAIARIGRRHDVPRGFGSRTQMLTNLLRGAAELGELAALMDSLDAEFANQDEALAELADTADTSVDIWRDRIASTRKIVREIATQVPARGHEAATRAEVNHPVA